MKITAALSHVGEGKHDSANHKNNSNDGNMAVNTGISRWQMMMNKANLSELWGHLKKTHTDSGSLYSILHAVMINYQNHPDISNIKLEVLQRLLHILEDALEPEVKCLVCAILGAMVCRNPDLKGTLLRIGVCNPLLSILMENSEMDITSIQLKVAAARMLQKLSFMPKHDWKFFSDVVPTLTKLCDSRTSAIYQYTAETCSVLEKLCQNKILVGHWSVVDGIIMQQKYEQMFGTDFKQFLLPNEAYCLQLYDASDPSVDVAEEMVNSNAAWPQLGRNCEADASSNQEELTDIKVTSIVDGATFWAQLGGEESQIQISQIQDTLSVWPKSKQQNISPRVGVFVVGHCENVGWFRGQIVKVDGDMASIFAMDYGFIISLEWNTLFLITIDMNLKQYQPQAVLCHLKGVMPRPLNCAIIGIALSTLANLARDTPTSYLNFSNSQLIDVVLQACSYPEPKLISAACNLLANLARADIIRVELANSNAVKYVLDAVCRLRVQVDQHEVRHALQSCFNALSNLMFNCPDCKANFTRENGLNATVPFTSHELPLDVKKAALLTLRVYTGKSNLNFAQEFRPRKPRRRSMSLNSRTCSHPTSGSDMYVGRRRSLSARRIMEANSNDEVLRSPLKTKSPSENGHVVLDTAIVYKESTRETLYVQGGEVKFSNDETHELYGGTFSKISSPEVAEIGCGFFNSYCGGSLFLGIQRDGRNLVRGVKLSHNERDQLRVGVDRAVGDLYPRVPPKYYMVHYHPVIDPENRNKLDDCFIVEVTFKPHVKCGAFYRFDHEYFYRKGKEIIVLSPNELHTLVVEDVEESLAQEKEFLEKELEILLEQVNGGTT